MTPGERDHDEERSDCRGDGIAYTQLLSEPGQFPTTETPDWGESTKDETARGALVAEPAIPQEENGPEGGGSDGAEEMQKQAEKLARNNENPKEKKWGR